ncbi:hypothetical protein Cs7R123_32960 [Catellatospora sp. TT07R-123]|uniref:DUF4328 domain-containing protein n=1 Tax=Catellatospora sp. TT07R-123 TaxID=2733863 RepID=UPI001B1DE707|nr:DUF4328 domain-containing protein [Catellatospora sp. TT07R-123]GHJ45954.1 hypothetical protein Cs7R123_32960 [Catellatospora sp. TT07R-123]
MICAHCGNHTDPNTAYCTTCGADRNQPPTWPNVRTFAVRGLGLATVVALAAASAVRLLTAVVLPLIGRHLWEQSAAAGTSDGVAWALRLRWVGTVVDFLVLVVTAVLVTNWLWRARKNLDAFPGAGSDLGAGWAFGGWITPLANFVIPCQLVFQVAKQSLHRRWVGPVVAGWWTCYLSYQFLPRLLDLDDLGYLKGRDYDVEQYLLVNGGMALVFAVAGGCLAFLVYHVSQAQTDRIARGEVVHAYAAYAAAAAQSVTAVPDGVPGGGQAVAGGTIQV